MLFNYYHEERRGGVLTVQQDAICYFEISWSPAIAAAALMTKPENERRDTEIQSSTDSMNAAVAESTIKVAIK